MDLGRGVSPTSSDSLPRDIKNNDGVIVISKDNTVYNKINDLLQNKTVEKIIYKSDGYDDREELIISFADGTLLKVGISYLVFSDIKVEEPFIRIT